MLMIKYFLFIIVREPFKMLYVKCIAVILMKIKTLKIVLITKTSHANQVLGRNEARRASQT